MADENEQKTLQDLFRVVNDMRGDMTARFDAQDAKIDSVDAKIDSVKDELKADIEASTTKLTEEADVIRKELLELASHQDFRELKGEIAEVRNDGRLTRQEVRDAKAEVSRLRADVKAAGIPVR
ncbi:MAG: hypothetical protein ACR2RE_31890 [Geminicoccaceae bacterium]